MPCDFIIVESRSYFNNSQSPVSTTHADLVGYLPFRFREKGPDPSGAAPTTLITTGQHWQNQDIFSYLNHL